jgi:cytochrome c553
LLSSGRPDLQRGARIAAQGLGQALACAQCHADNGGSDGSGAFPRIAGQSHFYLTKQLLAFASGHQNSAVMSPIAKALAPDDAADVSAHYAHASAPFRSLANVNHDLFRRGEILATIGNEKRTFRPASIATVPAGAKAADEPASRSVQRIRQPRQKYPDRRALAFASGVVLGREEQAVRPLTKVAAKGVRALPTF